jgi:hypothetical protein
MNGDGQTGHAQRPSTRTKPAVMVGVSGLLAIAVIAAGVYWWQPWNASAPVVAGAQAGKPSIAVLPFHKLSEDKAQSYYRRRHGRRYYYRSVQAFRSAGNV